MVVSSKWTMSKGRFGKSTVWKNKKSGVEVTLFTDKNNTYAYADGNKSSFYQHRYIVAGNSKHHGLSAAQAKKIVLQWLWEHPDG